MSKAIITLLFLTCLGATACQKAPVEDDHGHAHTGADAHDHGPADDRPTVSSSVWTDELELFVEYQPLVVGKVSSFAAHFSSRHPLRPLTSGKLIVSLMKGSKGVRNSVDAPTSPGIFRPTIKPTEAGNFSLVFQLENDDFVEQIVLKDISVYATQKEADAANVERAEDPDAIGFTKEQAWKIDFATAPVRQDTVFETIRCGGEIEPTRGTEKTVVATSTGLLLYKKRELNIGQAMRKGEVLFAVAGGGIIDRDLEARYRKASATLDQTKADFERKSELLEVGAIAKPPYEQAKLAFELAKTEFETLAANFSKGGKTVFASQSGFLKQLYKSEGEFVEAGEPLAMITENKTVTLRADVAPEYFAQLNAIHSANFILNGKPYSLQDLNGKLLSFGKSITREMPKVPVYFELANTVDLLPGSFVEAFIQLRPKGNGLLIPNSALLEDYGKYSVVVLLDGENFALRNVQLGVQQGREVQVLSGLSTRDRVVSTGAFQVKMAALAGSVPSHGHAH